MIEPTGFLARIRGAALLLIAFLLAAALNDDLAFSSLRGQGLDVSRLVLGYVLQIGLWLSSAILVNKVIRVLVWDGMVTSILGERPPLLLVQVQAAIVMLVAVAGILSLVLGQSLVALWAAVSGAAVIIGMALRAPLLDLCAGVTLNIERPFKSGDWIVLHHKLFIEEKIGSVIKIGWRTTSIKNRDNTTFVIPNGQVVKAIITNLQMPSPPSRFKVDMVFDQDIPTERMIRILTAAARSRIGQDGILAEPAPKIRCDGVDQFGVRYQVRYWIQPAVISPPQARGEIQATIMSHLAISGLLPAYRKVDVYRDTKKKVALDLDDPFDRLMILRRVPLFQLLPDADLQPLSNALEQRAWATGEALIRRGDAGESMFVMVEGLVEVLLPDENDVETIVSTIGPGRYFGEMSLLTGDSRSATIKAATEVVVWEITHEHVKRLLLARPEVADDLSRTAAELATRDRAFKESEEVLEQETVTLAASIKNKMLRYFGPG